MKASSTDDLIKLVEFEIKCLDDQKKELGISPWLLYAAAATLSWRVIEEWVPVKNWANVAVLWAIIVLSAEFATSLFRELRRLPAEPTTNPTLRFLSASKLLAGTKPYLLFMGAKITYAAAMIFASGILAGWPKYVWTGFYCGHLFGWLLIVGATFLDIPFSLGAAERNSVRYASFQFASLFQIAAMSFLIAAFIPRMSEYSAIEYRMALMLFALGEVVTLLLSLHSDNPARGTLIQLRRAIGLNEIDHDEAKGRLEITLRGASVSKFLQPRVQSYLSAVESTSNEYEGLIAFVKSTTELFQEGAPNKQTLESADTSLTQILQRGDTVRKRLASLRATLSDFEQRANQVIFLDQRAKPDVDSLGNSMKAEFERIDQKASLLSGTIAELKAAHDDYRFRFEQCQIIAMGNEPKKRITQ